MIPMSYFNLIDAFSETGCPVCRLLRSDAEHALDSLLYENANDADSHREFREGRGLCNTHGWQLARFSGYSLGTAVLYRATVNEVLKVIDQAGKHQPIAQKWMQQKGGLSGTALADGLEPVSPCFVCKLLGTAELTYVQVFAQSLADKKFVAAYRTSDGLCLPHFRHVLRGLDRVNADGIQILLAVQRALWDALETDLKEFEDKSSAGRMHEPMGEEGDSWRRAIGSMAGEPEVFGVNPRPLKQ